MQSNKVLKFIFFILLSGILILLDQYTKYYAENVFISNPLIIIDGVLELNYTKNTGAAFGIMKNQFIIFYIITFFVIIFILYLLFKTNITKKYIPFIISLLLIFSGSIGNLIDRVKNNYVIDFIYFKLIDFPLFNLADSYITIGAFLLIILFIFIYKEEDFDYVFKSK